VYAPEAPQGSFAWGMKHFLDGPEPAQDDFAYEVMQIVVDEVNARFRALCRLNGIRRDASRVPLEVFADGHSDVARHGAWSPLDGVGNLRVFLELRRDWQSSPAGLQVASVILAFEPADMSREAVAALRRVLAGPDGVLPGRLEIELPFDGSEPGDLARLAGLVTDRWVDTLNRAFEAAD